MEIIGILAFALIIGLSIALHEIGHLVPAKKFGVRVTEYMVGFGPTVWSTTRGETTYGIKGIPLGGYIRMIGMLPPAAGQTAPRTMATGRFAALVDTARRQSLDEVGPGDENRVFYRLSVPKRVVIMLGGPVMNLVLAFVLFAIVLVGIGLPKPTLEVAGVVPCTPSVQQPLGTSLPSGQCPSGSVETPAAAAGLTPGDVITAINGVPVAEWDEATAQIRINAGRTANVTLERNDSTLTIPVNIALVERPVYDEQGRPTDQTEQVGFLGVRPAFANESLGFAAVPGYMWDITQRSAMALLSLPVRVYELVANTLIGGQERDINGPVSVVGASRLGGEIAAMEEPAGARIASFLALAAALNLFLFLFNLLPVLPLDGGHVAGALFEGSRRTWARVRGRPDPGPVDVARLLPVAYGVAAVLIAVGVIVIWADLVRPLSLT